MTPPTKEQATAEMELAIQSIDFHGADWKALQEWLGWRRYMLSLASMAQADGAKRAELHGMSKICLELLNLKPLAKSINLKDDRGNVRTT